MSCSWFPPGFELHVDNPGYGHIALVAPMHSPDGVPAEALPGRILVRKPWMRDLYGHMIGDFLTALTTLALDPKGKPDGKVLPKFLTAEHARTLLPSFQKATILAAAGTDRHTRMFPDPEEKPWAPLCVRCNLGTYFSPGELGSDWCERHGHTPFGMGQRNWDYAQEIHQTRVRWWRSDREQKARDAALASGLSAEAVDLDEQHRTQEPNGA